MLQKAISWKRDGADAVYAEMMSSGKISVSQARAGQTANASPPPANVATAPSPAGIALAAWDGNIADDYV